MRVCLVFGTGVQVCTSGSTGVAVRDRFFVCMGFVPGIEDLSDFGPSTHCYYV